MGKEKEKFRITRKRFAGSLEETKEIESKISERVYYKIERKDHEIDSFIGLKIDGTYMWNKCEPEVSKEAFGNKLEELLEKVGWEEKIKYEVKSKQAEIYEEFKNIVSHIYREIAKNSN
jgi:hypothetical protein